jgi:uncharacterized protein (DUF58 family)
MARMMQCLARHSRLFDLLQSARGRSRAVAGPFYLVRRRVYILPTAQGVAFALALLLMLIGSINYSLSLGYMLSCRLVGTGVVAMLHTYRNLVHLGVAAGRTEAVFAGEAARFHLHLDNPGHYARYAICIRGGEHDVYCALASRGEVDVSLSVRSTQRGWLALPRLRFETRYPLGLFNAWAYVHLDMRALIYPLPDEGPLAELGNDVRAGNKAHSDAGTDDFYGLRPYHRGDSLRHIAWKAAARSDLLLTKIFSAQAAAERIFDFDALPAHLHTEARLARLAYGILNAADSGLSYGLRLQNQYIEAASGELQRERCLRALALFAIEPAR